MNYLAHIYLAGDNDKNIIGNLLGDFVSRTEEKYFEKNIREGILMHRKLDSFTDAHPIFLRSKSRISNLNRRFAGLLVDMFYDHFLAKNWSEFSTISLEEYTANFYKILKNFSDHLPNKLINIMPFMINENWLLSYKEIDGIEKALDRISKRISTPNYSLKASIDELFNNYQCLQNDFKSFFPHAIKYADLLSRSSCVE